MRRAAFCPPSSATTIATASDDPLFAQTLPELPEIESLRRSLEPRLLGRRIDAVEVWEPRLRWPVETDSLKRGCQGRRIEAIERRGKYLTLRLGTRAVLIHLGMSGRLRCLDSADRPKEKHDHIGWRFENGQALRFFDPRRFGCVEAIPASELSTHPRLTHLGVEPLSKAFDAAWVWRATRNRSTAIKSWLMNARQVVGVGNIYASEALFRAGLMPTKPTGSLTKRQCSCLVDAVVSTLAEAVGAGGTTLRDFHHGDGERGQFQHKLSVYAREGEPCRRCATVVRREVQNGRSSFFCPNCQR